MKVNEKYRDRIIVALDTPDLKRVKYLVKLLRKVVSHFKVGSELFTAWGPEAIKTVRWAGGHVFLDLKYHDIPNTVARAVREAAKLNISMLTIHTAGGFSMMEAARLAAEETLQRKKAKRRLKIFGVTVLTSLNQKEWNGITGVGLKPAPAIGQTVLHLAQMANEAGLDGVVASGQELPLIRSQVGKDFLVITPGIRPSWSVKGDQTRVMTPKRALELGADYLVIGRPITEVKDPLETAHKLIEEIADSSNK